MIQFKRTAASSGRRGGAGSGSQAQTDVSGDVNGERERMSMKSSK